MSMKSGFTGIDKAIQTLGKISNQETKEIKAFLSISAKKLETALKRQIQTGARTGTTYQKYNPRRTHKASGVGEPPKTDTGRLVNSIDGRVSKNNLIAEVFSKLDYALFLEFGTSKMKARPVWQPTFEEMKPKLRKEYVKTVNKVIKKNKK